MEWVDSGFSVYIDFHAVTNMKLNKDQKTFFPFLHSTLFLIALFLSVLISKRLYFNDDDIVYSREPTVTTIEPYTTRIYTGPTSSGRGLPPQSR